MSLTSQRRTRTSRRSTALLCLSLAALLCFVAEADACSWDYLIWIQQSNDADPLYRFVNGEHKAGYIDRAGKIVIEPKFDAYGNYGGEFREGLLDLSIGAGRYVDRTGEEVKPKPYGGGQFAEGLAAASDDETRLWGYVNRAGEFVISPRFEANSHDGPLPFSEGRGLVREDGLYGFIDERGKYVVQPSFEYAESFSDGFAPVGTLYLKEPKGMYYIDRGGRVAIPGPFLFASRFFKGRAHVEYKHVKLEKEGGGDWRTLRFAYIDARGKTLFSYQYDDRF